MVFSLQDQGDYTCYAILDAGEKSAMTKLLIVLRECHSYTLDAYGSNYLIDLHSWTTAEIDSRSVLLQQQLLPTG